MGEERGGGHGGSLPSFTAWRRLHGLISLICRLSGQRLKAQDQAGRGQQGGRLISPGSSPAPLQLHFFRERGLSWTPKMELELGLGREGGRIQNG